MFTFLILFLSTVLFELIFNGLYFTIQDKILYISLYTMYVNYIPCI